MADLGFLPSVRRLLAQTPSGGQRMLFSATLDRAIDALKRQFLSNPATHEADSAQSPVSTMAHHVLQVDRAERLPVLLDLTSAPGRTVVFTRTKHGAKALARQLSRSGVPAVELHGNLSQNARTRNLDDFHAGRATVLVATDIAARGIHVDDVALVIHADPPADHKAYLHRSGRTARAGNAGTVVTLATSDQAREVKQLTRAAGIAPTTTRIASAADPFLATLAPGARVLREAVPVAAEPARSGQSRSGQPRSGQPRSGQSRSGQPRSGQSRSGQSRGSQRAASSGSASGRRGRRPAAGRGRSAAAGAPAYSTSTSGAPTHSASSFSAGRR